MMSGCRPTSKVRCERTTAPAEAPRSIWANSMRVTVIAISETVRNDLAGTPVLSGGTTQDKELAVAIVSRQPQCRPLEVLGLRGRHLAEEQCHPHRPPHTELGKAVRPSAIVDRFTPPGSSNAPLSADAVVRPWSCPATKRRWRGGSISKANGPFAARHNDGGHAVRLAAA